MPEKAGAGPLPGDNVLHVLVPQAHPGLAPDGPPWHCASCGDNTAKLNPEAAQGGAVLGVRGEEGD